MFGSRRIVSPTVIWIVTSDHSDSHTLRAVAQDATHITAQTSAAICVASRSPFQRTVSCAEPNRAAISVKRLGFNLVHHLCEPLILSVEVYKRRFWYPSLLCRLYTHIIIMYIKYLYILKCLLTRKISEANSRWFKEVTIATVCSRRAFSKDLYNSDLYTAPYSFTLHS